MTHSSPPGYSMASEVCWLLDAHARELLQMQVNRTYCCNHLNEKCHQVTLTRCPDPNPSSMLPGPEDNHLMKLINAEEHAHKSPCHQSLMGADSSVGHSESTNARTSGSTVQ